MRKSRRTSGGIKRIVLVKAQPDIDFKQYYSSRISVIQRSCDVRCSLVAREMASLGHTTFSIFLCFRYEYLFASSLYFWPMVFSSRWYWRLWHPAPYQLIISYSFIFSSYWKTKGKVLSSFEDSCKCNANTHRKGVLSGTTSSHRCR
jgi:hypothetical protein